MEIPPVLHVWYLSFLPIDELFYPLLSFLCDRKLHRGRLCACSIFVERFT
jgi:hypothetical protein